MNMRSKLSLFLMVICVSCSASGLNILGIFDIPSRSLHILGQELLLGLAKRGYNVTMISGFPEEGKIANYTHIHIDGLVEIKEKTLGNVILGQSSLGVLQFLKFKINVPRHIFNSETMENFLKSDNKYDIIIQTYAMSESYLGLAHHFNARVIGFTPFSTLPHILTLTGNSAPYSYVPLHILSYNENMNFLQRTVNTLAGTLVSLIHKFYLFPQHEEILKTHFPEAPPLKEIENDRVDLIFSNAHFSSESPRPRTPNIIYIGGYHVQKPEALTHELQKLLDNAKEGVVFLGFGTNVETEKLPKEKIDAFVNKFANIPYKVLFKYSGVLPNKPENVETVSWVPQRGVLAHPNTKIFISHGGRGSTVESLYFGVPVLCVSFYADQRKNCEDIADYGYGVHLPYQEVTEDTFEVAFDELANNPKYKQNAKFRSALFQEQEMDPLDRAIFWIEHVHKFKGAKHLQPKSATMPLYQYLLLDVWAFILSLFSLLLLVFYKFVKFMFKLMYRIVRNTEKKAKVKRN